MTAVLHRTDPVELEPAVQAWQWVQQVQAGDTHAFGLIYERYFDTVYGYIYPRVAGRPQAEDFTSEVFLRALTRIGSFTWQGRDFGAWLVTIARNLIADHYKSHTYRREILYGEAGEREVRLVDGADVVAAERMDAAAVREAVGRLVPLQQAVITARYLQDATVEETAQATGHTVGAVKALQHRAMGALRRDQQLTDAVTYREGR